MNRQALLTHVSQKSHKKTIPEIRPGMTVRVSQKIKEGEKERVQNFEGLVIAVRGGTGIGGTFTVRKIVEGIGVEKVFPIHGATITKIQVLKEAKIRRSKLYYIRKLRGKSARMKEKYLKDVIYDEELAKTTEEAQLEVVEKLSEKPKKLEVGGETKTEVEKISEATA